MIVRAGDVEPEGLQIDAQLQIGPLEYERGLEIGVEGVMLKALVLPARGGLSCAGWLGATALVPCCRCLERYPMPINKTFDLDYLRAPAGGGHATGPAQDVQISKDDLDVSYLDPEGNLDLAQLAAEQIYLELPMKPLCSADCRGLCSGCGANLNLEACRCMAMA